MKVRTLYYETLVTSSPPSSFDFCSDPGNLQKLTPPQIRIKIEKLSEIKMGEGTSIHVTLKLFRFLKFRWITKITQWKPPENFIDTQPKGPYKSWKHTHNFVPKDNGTLIVDHVEYIVPGWIFEPIIFKLIVRRNLVALFEHRQKTYKQILG